MQPQRYSTIDRRHRFALWLLPLVLGCAPTFYKPGATEAEMAGDLYACENDPAYREMKILASAAPGFSAGIHARDLLKLCMQSKGYTVK